jgi:hypothetical protein
MPGQDRDGGVSTRAPTTEELQSYQEAYKQVLEMQVQPLYQNDAPNHRLFVAAFDGTGNHGDKAIQGRSNVAEIAEQYQYLANQDRSGRIAPVYLEGPGTQGFAEPTDGHSRGLRERLHDAGQALRHPVDTLRNAAGGASASALGAFDQATGHTFQQRLDTMYGRLQNQAQAWYMDDRNVQITLSNVGFSRGAEQAAGFARMVHDKGLVVEGANGPVDLVRTGQVTQAVALFDPVGTGTPWKHDRSLPASVTTGLQVRALDEQRDQFKDTRIVENGRPGFLNVGVHGAHSDIGGGYGHDGLSMLSGNLMREYLNKVSAQPMLQGVDVERDFLGSNRSAVHASHEGVLFSNRTFSQTGAREELDNTVRTPGFRGTAGDVAGALGTVGSNLGHAASDKAKTLYESALHAVGDLNERLHFRAPSGQDEQIASAAALGASYQGMDRVDSVKLNDGKLTVHQDGHPDFTFAPQDMQHRSTAQNLQELATAVPRAGAAPAAPANAPQQQAPAQQMAEATAQVTNPQHAPRHLG